MFYAIQFLCVHISKLKKRKGGSGTPQHRTFSLNYTCTLHILMSYLHYLLLNSNIAAHVHSLCLSYTINTVHTAHILFHTVYILFIYILVPYICTYSALFCFLCTSG